MKFFYFLLMIFSVFSCTATKYLVSYNGYPKAPPSIRIWGGSTVQNSDMKTLLPWIDWAYNSIKNNA